MDIRNIRRPKGEPRPDRPWSDDERDAVLTGAPPHIASVIALMLRTGLDPSDALRLRRGQVVDGWITGTRGKTGTPVAVPVSPALAEALSGAPAHDALMVLAFFRGATVVPVRLPVQLATGAQAD